MTNVIGGGFGFNIQSIGGTWSWRVIASNIYGTSQTYQVSDINTPFGRLTDVDIPIPSDVIYAIYDSLNQFQQQLAPQLQVTSPSVFDITVSEGSQATAAGVISFMNVGAFGSFMTVSLSSDVPWLSANPTVVPSINKNQSAQSNITINPSIMLASNSPYIGHINAQDNHNPPNLVPTSFNVIVLPRPIIQTLPTSINLSYYLSSMTTGGSQATTITNIGLAGSVLNVNLAKLQNQSPWLTFAPISGGPLNSGDTLNVLFSLILSSVPQIPGIYTEIVRVTSVNAVNSPVDIPVTLTVNP